jgi:hypothetical protein
LSLAEKAPRRSDSEVAANKSLVQAEGEASGILLEGHAQHFFGSFKLACCFDLSKT